MFLYLPNQKSIQNFKTFYVKTKKRSSNRRWCKLKSGDALSDEILYYRNRPITNEKNPGGFTEHKGLSTRLPTATLIKVNYLGKGFFSSLWIGSWYRYKHFSCFAFFNFSLEVIKLEAISLSYSKCKATLKHFSHCVSRENAHYIWTNFSNISRKQMNSVLV